MASLVKRINRRSTQLPAKENTKIAQTKRLVIIAFGLSVVFGLGWGLGLAATSTDAKEVTFVFQVIFSVFVGSQGILIFILHGLRSTDVRLVWKTWFSCLLFIKTGKKYEHSINKHGDSSTPKSAPTITYQLFNLKPDSKSFGNAPVSRDNIFLPDASIQEAEEGMTQKLDLAGRDGKVPQHTAGGTAC